MSLRRAQAGTDTGLAAPLARWPVELRLVLACLRAGLGFDARDQPPDIPDPDVEPDWPRFLFWVARHRVTPLVYAGLSAFAIGGIPDEVRERLRVLTHENARQMLRLGGELVRLLRAFDAGDIPALPMKGPSLALQLHGDLTMRQVRDLDLLVRLEDLDRAMEVLRSEGYRPVDGGVDSFTAKQRRIYENWMHHVEFAHPVTGIVVELHWRTQRDLMPTAYADLAGGTHQVRIAGRDVSVLGSDDLLMQLAAHGASHAWIRLSWLADFASLIPRASDEVWRRTWTAASRAAVQRPLAQGVLLSARLFGTAIPDPVGAWIETDRPVRSLAAYACTTMAWESPIPPPGLASVRDVIYKVWLKSSLPYRIRILRWLVFSVTDFREVALPDRLTWLYYVLRPFLSVRRYARRRLDRTASSRSAGAGR